MQKLLMIWLVGVAAVTLASPYTASAAKVSDENVIGAQAKLAEIQAILDDEDDEELQDNQEDRDREDGFEAPDDQAGPSEDGTPPT